MSRNRVVYRRRRSVLVAFSSRMDGCPCHNPIEWSAEGLVASDDWADNVNGLSQPYLVIYRLSLFDSNHCILISPHN